MSPYLPPRGGHGSGWGGSCWAGSATGRPAISRICEPSSVVNGSTSWTLSMRTTIRLGERAAGCGRSARAAGHRRQDHDRVALGDLRVEAIEHPHVLVVQVDVDVAVEVAVLGEELRLGGRVLLCQRAQHLADVAARALDLLGPAHGGTQHRWDLDHAHLRCGSLAGAGAESFVIGKDPHLLVGDRAR